VNAQESLPSLQVEIGGNPLERPLASALASVYVAQRLSLPAVCELTFAVPAGAANAAEPLSLGEPLRVIVGSDEPLFAGEVTAVSHRYGPANSHEIHVRGYDALHRLRKRRPVRAHVERTLAALAEDLVTDLGLSVRIDDEGPAWRRLMQWRQSDLELLADVASRRGLYFQARGTELQFVTFEGDGEPIDLQIGRSLLEAYFDASSDRVCRRVTVRGWNPWEASDHTATADGARSGRDVSMDAAYDDGAPRTLVDELMQSDAEGLQLAQAELDWHTAGEVIARGIAAGDPQLRPGARVELNGVDAQFEGPYVLTEVVHRVDRRHGFRSEFDTAPPPPVERTFGATTTLGVVIDVDDPDRLGRVRVTLPNHCDLETDWLAVVATAAGAGKGMAALPDVGDRVLLIVPRGDLAQGLVLGGLYATDGPADDVVRDGRVRCYALRLPGGQRLFLDGEHKTVRLENGGGNDLQLAPGRARICNSGGSYIELTKDRVRVHASTDLELEAPGKTVIVRGARVDFQTG